MFNIELHGFLDTDPVEESISRMFKGQRFAVTVCETKVLNKNGKEGHFLRLIDSDQDHGLETVEKLRTLGEVYLDIQRSFPKIKSPCPH